MGSCLKNEWKFKAFYDSGEVMEKNPGVDHFIPCIVDTLKSMGDDWYWQHWLLVGAIRGDEITYAIGVGSNKCRRERAAKLALALALQVKHKSAHEERSLCTW